MATLLLYTDASNPASWPYTGALGNPVNWFNVSGYSLYNSDIPYIYNVPSVVVDGAVKGVRMQRASGQRLHWGNGAINDLNSFSNLVYGSGGNGSFSISMWLKFNQAPVSGSLPLDFSNQPTWIFSAGYSYGVIPVCLGSNLGDTDTTRSTNRIAARFYDGGTSYIAGNWSPTVGIWYNVTIVCSRVSTYSGNLFLYINGSLNGGTFIAASAIPVFGPNVVSGYTAEWMLNASPYGSREQWGGDITYSTFKVWAGALQSGEVYSEFVSRAGNFGVTVPAEIPSQPVTPTIARLPNSMVLPNVWRTRSRGSRWIVPARDDYRVTNDFFTGATFITLYPVALTNAVIDAGEFGAFIIGDDRPTFEMLGLSNVTLAAATSTAAGTIT